MTHVTCSGCNQLIDTRKERFKTTRIIPNPRIYAQETRIVLKTFCPSCWKKVAP